MHINNPKCSPAYTRRRNQMSNLRHVRRDYTLHRKPTCVRMADTVGGGGGGGQRTRSPAISTMPALLTGRRETFNSLPATTRIPALILCLTTYDTHKSTIPRPPLPPAPLTTRARPRSTLALLAFRHRHRSPPPVLGWPPLHRPTHPPCLRRKKGQISPPRHERQPPLCEWSEKSSHKQSNRAPDKNESIFLARCSNAAAGHLSHRCVTRRLVPLARLLPRLSGWS